jgi:hypothetical protein
MIPWLQIDATRVPGAEVELRLMRRGDEFSMMLGPNELMNSRHAITGEGMGLAFRQARLLAECFEIGDFERYNRLHPAILQLPQTMARVMLTMDRSVAFRNRALRMLAAEPSIFARLLGVHLGSEPMGRFVATGGLELAWRMMVQRQSGAVPGVPA